MLRYRLGLDLGTNSLGWSIVALGDTGEPTRLEGLGVRIFSDGRNPKDGSSLAVMRRGPRQMRRRRDRYLRRRERFMQALIDHGLMPADAPERKTLESLDPYFLRTRGLDEKLPLFELGRALFHLNQRRGFQSNRKTDKRRDDDTGKIKQAIAAFREEVKGRARTVGEALQLRRLEGKPVRARTVGEGAKASYELYVDRALIAEEFDALWKAQQRFHDARPSDKARDYLRATLLHQRELRPVRPGRCTLEPNEERAPNALPSAQRFRLYQELNNLRVALPGEFERPLTLEERDTLAQDLDRREKADFDRLRKLLRLPDGAAFNLERNRKAVLGNATGYRLAGKRAFGKRWHDLQPQEQDEIVSLLLDEPSEEKVMHELSARWKLSHEQAQAAADTRLPDSFARLGRTAIAKVLPELRKAVVSYSDAVAAAGYASHSQLGTGELLERLPYYGIVLERHVAFGSGDPSHGDEKRYGRIANPSVHIGLNQLRKLVNALIERYGRPAEVHIELTRELKLSRERKEVIEEQNKRNRERNEVLAAKLRDLGQAVNAENLQRLKLWEELNPANPADRRCAYTGEQISIGRLFSPEVEIEHILPFERTLDDSMDNKTVSVRRANRDKGARTPHEAFSYSPPGYDWQEILARAANLPVRKRQRFSETALADFLRGQDFLARQLTDTAYLSRAAREYLSAICPENRIVSLPGRLTALLRGKWGLNRLLSDADRKDRSDHRHHAIDAVVVAATDRGMLQSLATASARARELGLQKLVERMPKAWEGFHEQLAAKIRRVVVSHKPDHGPEGALHNETAYGILAGPDKKDRFEVRYRLPVSSLTTRERIEAVRDAPIRAELLSLIEKTPQKEFRGALADFSRTRGMRHVRINETLSVIPVRDRNGKVYKAYKGDSNYCYEIHRDERGRWDGRLVTTFLANQKLYKDFRADNGRFRTQTFEGEPLVMRLCIDDALAIEDNGARRIMRVVKQSEGMITLAEHFESGNLKERDKDDADPFGYLYKAPNALRELKARRVFVDPLGRVLDPGFKG